MVPILPKHRRERRAAAPEAEANDVKRVPQEWAKTPVLTAELVVHCAERPRRRRHSPSREPDPITAMGLVVDALTIFEANSIFIKMAEKRRIAMLSRGNILFQRKRAWALTDLNSNELSWPAECLKIKEKRRV